MLTRLALASVWRGHHQLARLVAVMPSSFNNQQAMRSLSSAHQANEEDNTETTATTTTRIAGAKYFKKLIENAKIDRNDNESDSSNNQSRESNNDETRREEMTAKRSKMFAQRFLERQREHQKRIDEAKVNEEKVAERVETERLVFAEEKDLKERPQRRRDDEHDVQQRGQLGRDRRRNRQNDEPKNEGYRRENNEIASSEFSRSSDSMYGRQQQRQRKYEYSDERIEESHRGKREPSSSWAARGDFQVHSGRYQTDRNERRDDEYNRNNERYRPPGVNLNSRIFILFLLALRFDYIYVIRF